MLHKGMKYIQVYYNTLPENAFLPPISARSMSLSSLAKDNILKKLLSFKSGSEHCAFSALSRNRYLLLLTALPCPYPSHILYSGCYPISKSLPWFSQCCLVASLNPTREKQSSWCSLRFHDFNLKCHALYEEQTNNIRKNMVLILGMEVQAGT